MNGLQHEVVNAYGEEMRTAQRLADRFYQEGLEAYDQFLVGERDAKEMYLALLAMGAGNGIGGMVLGPPGGGKSLMLNHGHKVVGGIEERDVASVPHRDDLSPAKLSGESSEMNRSGVREGMSFEESFTSSVVPILRPGIKVVKFDEITRTSPLALNAALKITQDGRVDVGDDGSAVESSEFDLVISGANNHGTLFTHSLDPAVISRQAMGAYVGARNLGEVTEVGQAIWQTPNKHYGTDPEIMPVITRPDLHVVRAAINEVRIAKPERDLGQSLMTGMLDALEGAGITLAEGRAASQLLRVSRALSLLHSQDQVTETELHQAVRYGMTARLGAVTNKSKQAIDAVIAQVVQ